MALNLNRSELNVIWLALNDREGVLAGDYERAVHAKSWALANQISEDLKELRRVAQVVEHATRTAA
jgi:hypothetical protein